MPRPDWNERYETGNLPWDTNIPDEHLVAIINSGIVTPCNTLEVGCGTGTNSLWLAEQGFTVHGIDVSTTAIEKANIKKEQQSLSCEFSVKDFLHDKELNKSFDFVFDRGCLHVFDTDDERSLFAQNVSKALNKDGIWVSLIGSTEGHPRDVGPPRRTATEIIKAIEPYLEIVELRSVFFQSNHPHSARAWICIARQRNIPAQPSTIRGTLKR